MSLLKRIESARPAGPGGDERMPVPAGPAGGRDVTPPDGGGGSAGASQRLVTQLPARESFRDVKFRIQNRVIQEGGCPARRGVPDVPCPRARGLC